MFHALVELFWPWSGCLEEQQFPYQWELPARCLALWKWHTQHGHQTFHFLFSPGPLTQWSLVGSGCSQAPGSQDLDCKQFLQVTFNLLSSFCNQIGFLFNSFYPTHELVKQYRGMEKKIQVLNLPPFLLSFWKLPVKVDVYPFRLHIYAYICMSIIYTWQYIYTGQFTGCEGL